MDLQIKEDSWKKLEGMEETAGKKGDEYERGLHPNVDANELTRK